MLEQAKKRTKQKGLSLQNQKDSPFCIFLLHLEAKPAFGPHQRWCEMLHKNVLSRVVHTISGVIHNSNLYKMLLCPYKLSAAFAVFLFSFVV